MASGGTKELGTEKRSTYVCIYMYVCMCVMYVLYMDKYIDMKHHDYHNLSSCNKFTFNSLVCTQETRVRAANRK